jgi:peptidyl-tRNA hydrolase
VLSTFTSDERSLIDDAVKLSCEIVDFILRGDWGRAQERAEHHLK